MRRLRPKGFTLIEVLGALAILAGAVVSIILCGANGLAASRDIEQTVRSTLLAESEIEYIKGVCAKDHTVFWMATTKALGDGYLVRSWLWSQPGRQELRDAQVWVGYDTDGDGSLDASEIRIWLVTMLAEHDWNS